MRLMKTINHSHPVQRSFTRRRVSLAGTAIASRITHRHGKVLAKMHTMIRHPRSLARPVAKWRPLAIPLPPVAGLPALTATITRHRVGPRAKARIRGYDGEREPAYVVSLRITDPTGRDVDPVLSEGWVEALVTETHLECVHEVGGDQPTYVWLVDGHFSPVASPASLFAGFSNAA